MALDTIDHAISQFNLQAPEPVRQTATLPILGSANYDENGARRLQEQYQLEADTAAYQNRTYRDQADKVAALIDERGRDRLVENHPALAAKEIFAARYELAERGIDILARRMLLALLDTAASRQAAPKVLELMARELGWDEQRCAEERQLTEQRLTEAL